MATRWIGLDIGGANIKLCDADGDAQVAPFPLWQRPDELAAKAYKVLVEALSRANKVAIARIVMRNKEYLASVRSADGVLVLSTMCYADEINEVEGLDGLERAAAIEVTDAEMTQAVMNQARQYPGQERQFFEFVQQNPQMRQQLQAPIFEDKVIDFIVELADVTEKSVSKDDLQRAVEALEDEA